MASSFSEPVLSKVQAYRLWQAGAFGNRLCSWNTLGDWLMSEFPGKVALRVMLPTGGGPCHYDLAPREVVPLHHKLVRRGIGSEQIVICEAAPASKVVLQGEYLNGIRDVGPGLSYWGHFYFSRARLQMRDALRTEHNVLDGLVADHLIRASMTPSSYADWQELLVRYPEHVLEVSIYESCLGDIAGRNALVWEIRRY